MVIDSARVAEKCEWPTPGSTLTAVSMHREARRPGVDSRTPLS